MTLLEIATELRSKAFTPLTTRSRVKGQKAICHPERAYYARGLCQMCYNRNATHRPQRRITRLAAQKRWEKKNKERRAAYLREWWKRGNNVLKARLRQKYGLTIEQFNLLGARQEGRCSICSDPLTKPYVDHDHKTGQVRGLLCQTCNLGLGGFRDDPDSMRRAAAYVEHWKGVHQS